jgi:hypothetical protein
MDWFIVVIFIIFNFSRPAWLVALQNKTSDPNQEIGGIMTLSNPSKPKSVILLMLLKKYVKSRYY